MGPVSDAPAMPAEDRRLGFEARRFALETLVKIYIEQSNGSRALVVSHTRVMLTLAIAAMAGFVTVLAAILRGNPQAFATSQPVPAGLALCGLALLVTSALWATRALALAAHVATSLLRDPFPTARKELEEMFGARHEDVVLDNLVAAVQLHIADTAPARNFSTYATISLVAGATLAAASLVIPFVTIGR
ncbi:hypothetical protein ACFFJ7_00010 [Pseudochelatococcus lubricantis]|uniref:hypothetical protein n=1 Tax=Pseudochelatococcus lubricantis TaxID=1538102 RepID=UPI0035E9CD32